MIDDLILKYTSQKPKLFLFGGCDLWDACNINVIRDHYQIDRYAFSTNRNINRDICNRPQESTSLISLYTKPGLIAEQVQETLLSTTNLKYHHILAAEEILKYDYLNFFKKNASSNDILLLNFTNDLYTKFRYRNECFTILPQLMPISDPTDPLHWLYKKYISSERYHQCFDERDMLNETTESLRDFAKDIFEIFQNRVILVKFHFSNTIYCDSLENVKKIKWSCNSKIPFYKTSKIMGDPTDHSYAKRCANLILERFRIFYKSELPIIELDDKDCFIDANHRHGLAPLHLHPVTTEKIGQKIYEELSKMNMHRYQSGLMA